MSGGYFDYTQNRISDIADAIERAIRDEKPETAELFNDAILALRRAYIYAQRVDWYLCGDDGEDTFRDRLKADLASLDQAKP